MKELLEKLNQITSDISEVLDLAKQLNVFIDLDEDDKQIIIAWIENHGEKYNAKKVIQKLITYAKYNNKKIQLVALDNNPKLVKYYQDLGFKPTYNVEDGTVMEI